MALTLAYLPTFFLILKPKDYVFFMHSEWVYPHHCKLFEKVTKKYRLVGKCQGHIILKFNGSRWSWDFSADFQSCSVVAHIRRKYGLIWWYHFKNLQKNPTTT